MHVSSPTMPRYAAHAVAAGREIRSGAVLARVQQRVDNMEDGFTFTAHHELRAGGALGARSGYSTMRDAVRELRAATAGAQPAAAVMERGGRYYGRELRAYDLELGIRSGPMALHLEADEMSATLEVRAALKHERLRALVDGSFVHRFRS